MIWTSTRQRFWGPPAPGQGSARTTGCSSASFIEGTSAKKNKTKKQDKKPSSATLNQTRAARSIARSTGGRQQRCRGGSKQKGPFSRGEQSMLGNWRGVWTTTHFVYRRQSHCCVGVQACGIVGMSEYSYQVILGNATFPSAVNNNNKYATFFFKSCSVAGRTNTS